MVDSRSGDLVASAAHSSAPIGLLRAMRPKEWTKNTLVFAAPVFAGRITEGGVIAHTLGAFAVFCLVASSVYLINDTFDVREDRAHPLKRYRPIAAGLVSKSLALTAATLLAMAAGFLSAIVDPMLLTVVLAYVALNISYTVWLKHEPVLDIAIIAAGFVLRATAGGVANDVALSQWFLLIASFGSLFMAAGKRYAEVHLMGEGSTSTRRALAGYSASYLRFVWSISAAVLIMCYGLWSFEIGTNHRGSTPWAVVSMIPFVLAVLRYAVDVDAGKAGEPEDVALSDRVLQLLALAWLVTVSLAVYS